MKTTRFSVSGVLAMFLTPGNATTAVSLPREQPIYEVYAIRYATLLQ
jgi:hypothetical protein